jgi:hypothetical protein
VSDERNWLARPPRSGDPARANDALTSTGDIYWGRRLGPRGDGTLTDPKQDLAGTPLLGVAPVDLGMRVLVRELAWRQREGHLTERG